MRSPAGMAVPLACRFFSVEKFVAFDVAGVGIAAVADEDDVAVGGAVTHVAHPVQVLFLPTLVVELPWFHFMPLALVPEGCNFCPTVGTLGAALEPLLQARVAEGVLAL